LRIWVQGPGEFLYGYCPEFDKLAYQYFSIWLLDVAQQVPSTVQLDAFDISDKQFPHKDSRPDNMSFRVLDAFSQVPDELVGKYDVVHLRLWCCIVRDCNTAALIRHATQLLSRF
jgi:hypothetical protein